MPSREGRGMTSEPPEPRALTEPADRKPSKRPQRKLVKFFAKSREQWQGKCREAKAGLQQLKSKLQGGQESQQRWQSRVKALAGANSHGATQRNAPWRRQGAREKKRSAERGAGPEKGGAVQQRPCRQQCSLGHLTRYIS